MSGKIEQTFKFRLLKNISHLHLKNSIFRRPFQYFPFRIFCSSISMGRPLSYKTANYHKDLSKILVNELKKELLYTQFSVTQVDP